MKKKDVAVNAAVYFVFVILSCVFARVFSNMAVKLVDLLVELQFISASGVRVATLMLFSAFLSFLYPLSMGIIRRILI